MIKKWVLAAIAYLILVMVVFGIYQSVAKPEPMDMDMKVENHGN